MKLEEKLAALRKEKGLSQLKLAEMMNVSRQAVSRWEAGDAVPSTEKLKGLSSLYNVSVDVLLNDEIDLIDRDKYVPNLEIPGGKESAKKKWSKQVTAAVFFLLVAVVVFIYIVATQPKQKMGTIPIGKMEEDVIDPATEEVFDIDW